MKILDEQGLQYLWKQISLEDYPNNETLIAVLNAIDETKADKDEVKPADLVANITAVTNQETFETTWSCDILFEDLWAAYEEGKDVVFSLSGYQNIKGDFNYVNTSSGKVRQIWIVLFSTTDFATCIISEDNTISYTDAKLLNRNMIKQETGTGRGYMMSQKAVTDALALKADQTALDAVSTLVGGTSVSEQINSAIDAIPQPDWNQNDETAKDYVKNKPFYTSDPVETVIVEETTFELVDGVGQLTATQPLEAGQEYVVTLDGTQHNAVCKSGNINGGMNIPYLGNVFALGGEDTGESFFIAPFSSETELRIMVNSDVLEHTVSVVYMISEVHQLDEKYVPDTIARIGDLNDALARKAENTDIVKPDWSESNAEAVGYVKNRPFYSNFNLELTCSFANFFEEDNLFYVTSEDSVIKNKFVDLVTNNEFLYVDINGRTEKLYCLANEMSDGILYSLKRLSDNRDVVSTWDYDAFLTYCNIDKISLPSSFDAKFYTEDGVRQLDEKYIPDTIARVPTDEEMVELLMETGIADPAANSVGAIYTDNNGNLYTL